MPKIEAPTLREHREMRRTALLNAGRELALEHGGRAVTMAAVAARSGLSRPAVYEYFDSTEALLSELAVAELADWTDEVGSAVDKARTPAEKVRAYIRASLGYVSSGRHALAEAIGDSVLPEIVESELASMHRRTQRPIEDALRELGAPDPVRHAAYVQAVVAAAGRRITAGARARSETRAAEEFVLASLPRGR